MHELFLGTAPQWTGMAGYTNRTEARNGEFQKSKKFKGLFLAKPYTLHP